MNIVHIIACLFALIGAVPAITLLSPVKVAHRAVPSIMIAIALALWFLPTGLDVALALVPVAAYISSRLGIEHAGHEPVNVASAVAKARSATQKVRERLAKPQPVHQFVKPGDPGVLPADEELADADAAAIADDDPDDEDEQSSTDRMPDKLDQLTRDPRMPVTAQTRLAGQGAGRDTQPSIPSGLRSGATRSFVPSLLG